MRFYRNNDGAVAGVPGAARPGTLLYDSGPVALNQYPMNGNTTADGNTLEVFRNGRVGCSSTLPEPTFSDAILMVRLPP